MAKAINLIISDPVKRANLEKRFWPKVKIAGPDDCWEWTASKRYYGYGQITAGKKFTLKSNQVAFALKNGPIPDGLSVRHSCDNTGCCNPNHLLLGTHRQNMQDCLIRGRSSKPPEHSGEKHHKTKLSEEDAISIIADARTNKAIAEQYDVAAVTVRFIKSGRNWKKLKRPG